MKKNSLGTLMSYLGSDRWLFALSILLNAGWVAANTLGIAFSLRLIMNAVLSRSIPMLVTGAQYVVATAVSMSVFGASSNYLLSLCTERVSGRLRERLFDRVLHATSGYLDAHESGDTISMLVNDLETAKLGYATLHHAADEVGQIVLSMGTLFIWSWPTALIILTIAILCLFAGSLLARPVKALSEKYQTSLAGITEFATNVLSGVAMIKGLNAGRVVGDRFGEVIEEHRLTGRARARLLGAQNTVMNAIPFMALSAVVYVAGSGVFAGALTAGDAVAVVQLSTRSMFPFSSLGNIWATLQQNLAASDRVARGLRIPQETDGKSPFAPSGAGALALEFDDVTFAYGDKLVLNGTSFHLEGGKKMALVGSSGSGKTTILKLVLGMYTPTSGAVRVGGVNVTEIQRTALRRSVAVVPQEPWLFPGSIKENILLGREGASDEDIVQAAEMAHAREFIESLPEGYDTVLDERGSNLSGGQRQRLCLARAFLKDAPLLFLDEPTSSVDAESERLISDAVKELSIGRTVITIAHSTEMIDQADVRVELDNGRAVTV